MRQLALKANPDCSEVSLIVQQKGSERIGQVYLLKSLSGYYQVTNKRWHRLPIVTSFTFDASSSAQSYWIKTDGEEKGYFKIREGLLTVTEDVRN